MSSARARSTTRFRGPLRLAFSVASVAAVNLLEEDPRPLPVVDSAVELAFSPFEIVTLKVTPQDTSGGL